MTPKDARALSLAYRGLRSQLGGVAGVVNNPITRLGIRYWWASIPVIVAAWGKYQERKEKGDVRLHHVISDVGTLLGPVMTIIAMTEFAKRDEERKNATTTTQGPSNELPGYPS